MSTTNTWMVRAGRGGKLFQEFFDASIVAIGWYEIGKIEDTISREDLSDLVRRAYPGMRDQKVIMTVGQVFRFVSEFKQGDRVVTYDPGARTYLCGTIAGPLQYVADEDRPGLTYRRKVKWSHELSRNDLSSSAQNSLGAISTIFRISQSVSSELWRDPSVTAKPLNDEVDADDGLALSSSNLSEDDVMRLANEAIKDRLAGLSWQEMQALVAGLLRAMGYKTTVSPPGADRGKDIVASPDGLGFQEPRIVVEVKHRQKERIGAPEIRSFVGGRHPKDKGLFVSTGGFSKEAHHEAERANIPLTLMDFESLTDAVLEYYPQFDEETKQLLPLRRVYWPI